MLVVIVTVLTQHQRKMAEIMRNTPQANPEVERLRDEVLRLKQIVHDQAIALDNLAPRPQVGVGDQVSEAVRNRIASQ